MGSLFVPSYLFNLQIEESDHTKGGGISTVFTDDSVACTIARIGNPNITLSRAASGRPHMDSPHLRLRNRPFNRTRFFFAHHSPIYIAPCYVHSSTRHSSSWSFSPSSSLMSPRPSHRSPLSSSKTTLMHTTHSTLTTSWSLTLPLPSVRARDCSVVTDTVRSDIAFSITYRIGHHRRMDSRQNIN